MKSRAFTLIELLVVVLIIGVLTAIALPKYQVAVQKSRFATLMPTAKSVKNAEEAMLMARGSYSNKLADLDINLPGTPDGDSKVTNSEGNSFTVNTDDNQSYVRALTKDTKNAYVMYFAKSTRYPGEIHCEAETDNKVAVQVCQSYGNTNTVTGTTSGYTAYVLEGTGTDAGSITTSGCGNDCWNNTPVPNYVIDSIEGWPGLGDPVAGVSEDGNGNYIMNTPGGPYIYNPQQQFIQYGVNEVDPDYGERIYLDASGNMIGHAMYNSGNWICDGSFWDWEGGGVSGEGICAGL